MRIASVVFVLLLSAPFFSVAETCPAKPQVCPVGQVLYYVPDGGSCVNAQMKCRIVSTTAPAPETPAAPSKSTAPQPVPKPTQKKTQVSNTPRILSRGMSGSDVTTLQQFLISQDFLAAGNATGFFGALTEAAVKTLQQASKIVSSGSPSTTGYGAVGPRTRALISTWGSTTKQTSNPIVVTPPVPASCPIASKPLTSCNGSWQSVANDNGCTIGWKCQTQTPVVTSTQTIYTSTPSASPQCAIALRPTTTCAGTWQADADDRGCTSAWKCTSPTIPVVSSVAQCAVITPPACDGTLSSLGVDTNNCNKGYLCTLACQQYATLQCGVGKHIEYAAPSVSGCAGAPLCVNDSVTPSAAPSCTLDGVTIASGNAQTFYSQRSVEVGTSCSTVGQTRTCTSGSLSGPSTYQYGNCQSQTALVAPTLLTISQCAASGMSEAACATQNTTLWDSWIADATKGSIDLPSGNIPVNTLKINRSVKIGGQGKDSTHIIAEADTVFSIGRGVTKFGVTMSDIGIDGKNRAVGIAVKDTTSTSIHDIRIDNPTWGIKVLENNDKATFANILISKPRVGGMLMGEYVGGPPTNTQSNIDTTVNGMTIEGDYDSTTGPATCQYGVAIYAGTSGFYGNNITEGRCNMGFYLAQYPTGSVASNIVPEWIYCSNQCLMDTNADSGWYAKAVRGLFLTNACSGNNGRYGIGIESGTNIQITGTQVNYSGNAGIALGDKVAGVTLSGNHLVQNNRSNVCASGVYVGGGATQVDISSNTITNADINGTGAATRYKCGIEVRPGAGVSTASANTITNTPDLLCEPAANRAQLCPYDPASAASAVALAPSSNYTNLLVALNQALRAMFSKLGQ